MVKAPHVNILNSDHIALEKQVTEFLRQRSYVVPPAATFHSICNANTQLLLKTNLDPTSMYIRYRADQLAVKPGYAFEYEVKTCSERHPSIAFEALAFAHHVIKAALGVRCLYCVWHKLHERHYGFWIHRLPPIKLIMIPQGTHGNLTGYFRKFFAHIPIKETPPTNGGSNTPFVIIDAPITATLSSWQDLVDRADQECLEHNDVVRHGQQSGII